MKNNHTLLSATGILMLASPAMADTHNVDLLQFSIGYFDILDDKEAVNFRVEYRPDSQVFIDNLKPFIGAELTSEGTLWGGAGLLYDWNVAPEWYVTPSMGVGLYAQGSSDKDLGHPIEFRTQLEISYEFKEDNRVSLGFSHHSNAGLDDENPGTEILSLGFAFPF